MKYLAVLLLAAAASADVRDALRDPRQAIVLGPQQFGLQLLAARPVARPFAQPLSQRLEQPLYYQQPAYQPTFRREPQWRILQQSQEADPAGPYSFSFETENGIRVAEEGSLARDQAVAKRGSFAYTAPDGTPIALSWVADENGFRAVGDHLPTPPPIPEAILRSLEQNARDEARGDFGDK